MPTVTSKTSKHPTTAKPKAAKTTKTAIAKVASKADKTVSANPKVSKPAVIKTTKTAIVKVAPKADKTVSANPKVSKPATAKKARIRPSRSARSRAKAALMKLQKDSGANKDVFSDDKGRLMLSELFRSAGRQARICHSLQISDCLPDSVENVEDATKGIAMILREHGIALYDSEPDQDELLISEGGVSMASDDDIEDQTEAVISSFVGTTRTTDPVRMYMREMSYSTLLTREQERKFRAA